MSDWVGVGVGVLGVLLGIILYYRSKERPRLAIFSHGMNVVGAASDALGDVEVRFRGTPVPRVSSTSVILWNAGNATLDAKDAVERDPLRIEVPAGASILRAVVAKETRSVLAATVAQPDEAPELAFVDFDFLDPGDGIRVELLHTAPWSNVEVRGTYKGAPEGIRDRSMSRSVPLYVRFVFKMLSRPRLIGGVILALGIFFVLAAVAPLSDELRFVIFARPSEHFGPVVSRARDVGIGLLYALAGGAFLWRWRRRYPPELDLPVE